MLLAAARPAAAQDFSREAAAAAELQLMCAADAGRLWGESLCGPLLVASPDTRQAWASQQDQAGVLLRQSQGGWAGALPADVPVANSAVDWAGLRWIMVVGPLPEEPTQRRVLLAGAAWRRIAAAIGLPASRADASHLDTERGRTLLRLEMRALATAMLSRARARTEAGRDALAFRMARWNEFPGAAAAEASLDRYEGLAAYTGVRLGLPDNPQIFAARTLDQYDRRQALGRTYAAATGPAYGLLLDEIAPGWRSQLGSHAPADLLVSPLRAALLSGRDLDRAMERYGAAAIAAEERARASAQSAPTRQ
ncbi:MAG: hypothetical protein JNJ63_05010 [Hyphomonadaceae bacterium]|nr:hypothetical protein [Hyphomonadaceae bacterium]